ncbi:MAG: hypothetical protein C4293_16000 [Nitrospiraceae bacterium]
MFYVFPGGIFISYASEIHLVETDKRQRKPRSAEFRDAWTLILQWAARRETFARSPVKVGEAVGGVTPSQALVAAPVKV